MASAACQAVGTPDAQDIRSGFPPGPAASAASPTAYTSGWDTERMVASTTMRPVSVTSSVVAFARGCTANPVVHTVTSAGTAVPSAVTTWSAATAVTAAFSYAVTPRAAKTFRRWRRPLGESQSPRPPLAVSDTSRSGRASAISDAASRPVSPPPTTTTDRPAASPARRSRSRSAPGRPAISWACSAAPGTSCGFQALPRA
ncbi:hypothetical protein SVIOM342S_08754 [Streptomyces violaceorubidus]